MRILDRESLQLDLAQLGFDPGSLEQFQRAIHQPHGMVLITGPTGSGKTTTLYSAIHTLNSPDINIMTAEDPVEYNLAGVNQVQVNEEIGRTFAAALRAFLRQDPDVILVGETRDLETAQIAIRAALTGHLVLTTLHTNDCPCAVARLLDMGIAPFLVASSLASSSPSGWAGSAGTARRPTRSTRRAWSRTAISQAAAARMPCRGAGCATCSFTGMKGRVAIYEVMPVGGSPRPDPARSHRGDPRPRPAPGHEDLATERTGTDPAARHHAGRGAPGHVSWHRRHAPPRNRARGRERPPWRRRFTIC